MANFEKDPGDILSMVIMLERHLIRDGVFDTTSKPSLEQVEEALEETEQEIFAWLVSYGYSDDILGYPNTAKQYLTWFAALGTAYRLELSAPGIQSSPRGNSRWEVLFRQYTELKTFLESNGLVGLGVDRSRAGQAVLTGVSYSDKSILESDPDKVQSWFKRDTMRNRNRGSQTTEVLP